MNDRTQGSSLFQDAVDFAKANWWMFLLGGLLYIIFGVLALSRPADALLGLSVLFACFITFDGAISAARALMAKGADGRWWVFFGGLVSMLVGIYALTGPVTALLLFVTVIAIQAIFFGIAVFMFGLSIRRVASSEWVLYLTGILSVIFGLLLIWAPGIGGISVSMMIGGWSLVVGILRVLFAFRVRSLVRHAM